MLERGWVIALAVISILALPVVLAAMALAKLLHRRQKESSNTHFTD